MKTAKLTDKLSNNIDQNDQIEDKSHALYGKKIVLSGFKDKKRIIEKLKAVGGENASSVTKQTFIVVVGDKDCDTDKANQAMIYEIPVLTKDEFEAKYF